MHTDERRTIVLTLDRDFQDTQFLEFVRDEALRAGPFRLVLKLPAEVAATLDMARSWLSAVTDPRQPLTELSVVPDTTLARVLVHSVGVACRARGSHVPLKAFPTLEHAWGTGLAVLPPQLQAA